MIGTGAHVFAVWGYVIANQKPDRAVGSQVDLNPKLLAFIIGEPEQRIITAIDYLCAPDPLSKSPEREGRRLVKLGQFSYQVVNGAKYLKIRDEESRREQNRNAKRKQRSKGTPLPGEQRFVAAERNGAPAEVLDRLSDPVNNRRETAKQFSVATPNGISTPP